MTPARFRTLSNSNKRVTLLWNYHNGFGIKWPGKEESIDDPDNSFARSSPIQPALLGKLLSIYHSSLLVHYCVTASLEPSTPFSHYQGN